MITRIAMLALIFATMLRAEDIVVYRCDRGHRQKEAVSMGDRLAVFTTGQKSLQTICDNYRKISWTAEPFYGPIIPYIFKDSRGKLFVVHFEFQEGHNIIGKGVRFAMAPLKAVPRSKGLYSGSPYDGSSVTDEGLLKQLRELAAKKGPTTR